MESARLVVSARENPRGLLGLCNNAISDESKAMPNDLPQKSLPTVVDRFRVLLQERDDALRISDDDIVPPTSMDEVVRIYDRVLSELTFNSKPIITDLTIIAGEQREHAEGIADAICARIIEAPVDHKLPSLYLVDSIVKNIGQDYIRHFSSRLPEVFCEAYRQVNPSQYSAMRHLFGTWSAVFPKSVLRKIEVQLQFSPRANHQSPRPSHGIHVNPKYLEARRQFEQSAEDRNARGASSNLRFYERANANGYDEEDSDCAEDISMRLKSGGAVGHISLDAGVDKPFPHLNTRLTSPPSPSCVGHARSLSPGINELSVGNSPKRIVGRVSPSHSGVDYGVGRLLGMGKETNDWRRRHRSDDNHHPLETSSYNHKKGHDLDGPRALIDAYGNDRGKRTLNDKSVKVECLDAKLPTRAWQTTEEEEYNWEDMSPTLVDRSRSNDFSSSNLLPPGNYWPRLGSGPLRPETLELDSRNTWSSQAQLPLRDNCFRIDEDSVPMVELGHGLKGGKFSVSQNERNLIPGSQSPLEGWNMPNHLPRSSQHSLDPDRRGFQRTPSPVTDDFLNSDSQLHRLSRMNTPGLDSVNVEASPSVASSSTRFWPPINVNKLHPHPALPIFQQKLIRSRFDLKNGGNDVILNRRGPNKSPYLPEQQFDCVEKMVVPGSTKWQLLPNQQAGLVPSVLPNRQLNLLQPQVLSQDGRENFVPSLSASLQSHLGPPPFVHGYTSQGHGVANAGMYNQMSHVNSSLPIQNMQTSSLHVGNLPPLPPGPPPTSQGSILPNQPHGSAFKGLISSLVAKGLISLTTQTNEQDSVGIEFNPDILKIRHESAIKALYADLPRQCKTCGLRFKTQEEHSSHMDWHVTKNRISKNHKQTPSRKWFVSASMWLRGTEALGTEAASVFLPSELVVEKKEDDEMAVPADEDQNVCALCGEPFDDFYSDETDEWMYKGAVYMNAPNGKIADLDKSQLGPIVHAKCRSESSVAPPDDFVPVMGDGQGDDPSPKKRRLS